MYYFFFILMVIGYAGLTILSPDIKGIVLGSLLLIANILIFWR